MSKSQATLWETCSSVSLLNTLNIEQLLMILSFSCDEMSVIYNVRCLNDVLCRL